MNQQEFEQKVSHHIDELSSMCNGLFVCLNYKGPGYGVIIEGEQMEVAKAICASLFKTPEVIISICQAFRFAIESDTSVERNKILQVLNQELVKTLTVLKNRNLPTKN